jgi:hypothetical protein
LERGEGNDARVIFSQRDLKNSHRKASQSPRTQDAIMAGLMARSKAAVSITLKVSDCREPTAAFHRGFYSHDRRALVRYAAAAQVGGDETREKRRDH